MNRWISISVVGLVLAAIFMFTHPGAEPVALADDAAQKKQPAAQAKVHLGAYRAEGTVDGQIYQGRVNIQRRGDTYVVVWVIGKDTYAGIGIVDGDTLSVSCIMQGQPCVVVYKIKPDGVLEGRWSAKLGVIESERLTLVADKA